MNTFSQASIDPGHELAVLLDRFDTCCDPDFDDANEELERQFAELRLTLGNR